MPRTPPSSATTTEDFTQQHENKKTENAYAQNTSVVGNNNSNNFTQVQKNKKTEACACSLRHSGPALRCRGPLECPGTLAPGAAVAVSSRRGVALCSRQKSAVVSDLDTLLGETDWLTLRAVSRTHQRVAGASWNLRN